MDDWVKKVCSDKAILGFLLLFNLLMATILSLKFYYLYTEEIQLFGFLYKAPWYYNSKTYFIWYMSLSICILLLSDIVAGYFIWQKNINKALKVVAIPIGLLIIRMFI